MSNRYRRYSKRELLGSLYVDYVMSVTDLGLTPKANRWDVLRAFLDVGEARAERLVEETGGFLLLQSVPGRPNTGAIYAYIERLQASLAGLDPTAVLGRGYSITRNAAGEVLRDAARAREGERIFTTLAQGSIQSKVKKRELL